MKPRSPILLLVLLSVVACEPGAPGSTVVSRDSAGVQLVEASWDESPIGWRVDSLPAWVLGEEGGSGGLALHDVRDARLLSDEVVAIADGGSQQLLRVDLASGSVDRWGGAGDGPAEFRGLESVFEAGNGGLIAYDRVRGRLVELAADGRLVREVAVPPLGSPGDFVAVLRGDPTQGDDAFFVAQVAGVPTTPVEGPHRGPGAVIRLSQPADTITLIRGTETFVGGGAVGGVLFGGTTRLSGSAEGLWIGDTDDPEVTLWSGSDGPERIVRWESAEPRLLTEERKEEFWRRFEAGLPPQQRSALPQMRALMPFAETVPAFGSLASGPGGQLWIGGLQPPESAFLQEPSPPQEWLVLNFEAGEVGRVVLPAGFRLLEVGESWVLGVHTDDLGVETVRLYRFALTG